MKTCATTLLVLWLLTTLRTYGQGTFIYDQQATNFLEGGGLITDANQPIGQSFTPSLSAVNFITLNLYDARPSSAGGSVYVNLRSNSITGPILGISDVITMAYNNGGEKTFLFPSDIPLIPGTMYFFQPILLPGSDEWGTAISQGYAGGTAFVNGVPVTGSHFWFREGIVVPKPSSASLIFLGTCMATWYSCRTRGRI